MVVLCKISLGAIIAIIYHVATMVNGFAVSSIYAGAKPSRSSNCRIHWNQPSNRLARNAFELSLDSSTQLLARSTDGTDVGIYGLVIVLTICVWFFTVPPSFRRAHICSVEPELYNVDPTCVSLQEWTGDVQKYYKNGGGIQWDFSVDPATKARNEQTIEAIFGDK